MPTQTERNIQEKLGMCDDVDSKNVNVGCVAYHLESLVSILSTYMPTTDEYDRAMREIELVLDDLIDGVEDANV